MQVRWPQLGVLRIGLRAQGALDQVELGLLPAQLATSERQHQ